MADTGSYPSVPYRPNFVDVRTVQVHEEKITDTVQGFSLSSSWQQLYAAGATLENGVTLKGRRFSFTAYAQVSTTGNTADGGFELDAEEEVFIAVRQLSDVWVKIGRTHPDAGGLAANPSLTWKAS
jgi:hypothetical protein